MNDIIEVHHQTSLIQNTKGLISCGPGGSPSLFSTSTPPQPERAVPLHPQQLKQNYAYRSYDAPGTTKSFTEHSAEPLTVHSLTVQRDRPRESDEAPGGKAPRPSFPPGAIPKPAQEREPRHGAEEPGHGAAVSEDGRNTGSCRGAEGSRSTKEDVAQRGRPGNPHTPSLSRGTGSRIREGWDLTRPGTEPLRAAS